ncbi:sulfatase [Puniceicoccales bacterium CK1056]|uniref:Sulfatase n=1 Tax=Oceanipulchritudo coccoides TaxID=2706888 RepID=A0A6B2M6A0_9BACT|nr:sulfatase [Oceanipulchritudo coccoides]NDV63190.1 sulfatase [Oceanipulchritudo coccoides]
MLKNSLLFILLFSSTVTFGDRPRLLPAGNYNVLFIPIDDFRVLINAYGETEPLRPITPNMDRLTEQGVSFSNAHCQQAVCNASRASLMTGLRPDTTRCWKLDTFFRDTVGYDLKTLPQHFADQGYSTHGIGKIYHNTNSTSQDDNPSGARSWSDGWDANAKGAHVWYEAGKAAQEDAGVKKVSATDAGELDRAGNPITDEAYDDGAAAAAGVAKIGTYAAEYNSSGTPFFLAVGFKKPHLPFNCPKEYWDLYDPAQIDLTGYDGSHDMPAGTNHFTAPYGGEPEAFLDVDGHPDTKAPGIDDARHLIHGYLACASFIDTQVGKLLAALEDPDGNPATDDSVATNTIVILWSDHGFFLGEHNGFWAKHANYEISTRVPLIVKAPGMDALGSSGSFCPAPVELVDIYPTLVNLCSLPDPVQPAGMELQGTSFLPLLEDPKQPWKKAAFSQYQRYINANGSGDVAIAHNGTGMGYSIRTARYRYTEWWRTVSSDQTLDLHVPVYSSPEHVELYDHLVDPGETVNLAAQPAYAGLVTELSALLNDTDNTFAGDGWKQTEVNAPAEFPLDYSSWSDSYGTPGVPAGSLDLFIDPDADGWMNIFEYKFGTHPLEPDQPDINSWVEDNKLVMTYPEIISRTDASLEVFKSNDLSAASWNPSDLIIEGTGSAGNADILKASSPLAESPLFIRLQAQTLP